MTKFLTVLAVMFMGLGSIACNDPLKAESRERLRAKSQAEIQNRIAAGWTCQVVADEIRYTCWNARFVRSEVRPNGGFTIKFNPAAAELFRQQNGR